MDESKADKVKALLLTCMDFRYPQAIVDYMDERHLNRNYDHVILAGASLGACLDSRPHRKLHWRQTFFDHLDVALLLHSIEEVYILDHRDCGAYREFRGLPRDVERHLETRAHRIEMEKLKRAIVDEYSLPVTLGLLERLEGEKFTVMKIE